jgi:hypothetical protein
MQDNYLQGLMKKTLLWAKKTNPKQSQFKPIKANFKGKTKREGLCLPFSNEGLII